MKRPIDFQLQILGVVAWILAAGALCACAQTPDPMPAPANPSGLYVKVQLNAPVKFSKLKPGDAVEGTLARAVYSGDQELFPAGSHVRLVVDSLTKRRRVPNDHWPGVVKLFTPRHENFPVFKNAAISDAEGQSSLRVSLIDISRQREVVAQGKKRSASATAVSGPTAVEVQPAKSPGSVGKQVLPTIVLEGFPAAQENTPSATAAQPSSAGSEVLPIGTLCKILLLNNVSASKSKPGNAIEARLLEPVVVNSYVVLPAGTLVEGKVVKRTPPRMLSRAGSLYVTFTGMTLPGGNRVPVEATLAAADLDRRSHTKIDPEGVLHGEHPGKAWMAINLGVTAGVAKEADDTFQIIVEAIVSTATDASTAGSARIISTCASAIYMATRHGRDVVLPRFTELSITLDRPLSVNANNAVNRSVPHAVAETGSR